MGDSGSYFRSSISVLTLISCSNNLLSSFENITIQIHFAVCLLLLPILDMTYVISKESYEEILHSCLIGPYPSSNA